MYCVIIRHNGNVRFLMSTDAIWGAIAHAIQAAKDYPLAQVEVWRGDKELTERVWQSSD